MKSLCSLSWFILLLMPLNLMANADLATKIQKDAQKCIDTFFLKEHEIYVECTHPKIVSMLGGKETMIKALEQAESEMLTQGITLKQIQIGMPEIPKSIGNLLVSTVPQHLTMEISNGVFYQDAFLLGISENNGENWTFVDVDAIKQTQLEKIFPEFAGHLTVPAKQKPVFKSYISIWLESMQQFLFGSE